MEKLYRGRNKNTGGWSVPPVARVSQWVLSLPRGIALVLPLCAVSANPPQAGVFAVW